MDFNNTFKRYKFKLLFITTFFVLQLSAQSFENIESLIGLSGLEDNNGVAVADYDNDQDLDFFIVAKAKEGNEYKAISRLFKNNNDGSFTDVTLASGLVSPILEMEWDRFDVGLDGVKLGASWGDFNNDGYADIFLSYLGKVELWKNLGNGEFENISLIAGFEFFNGCANTTSTWFDYNNDGFLDLFIADWAYCSSSKLYLNNTDETFTDVTESTVISEFNQASFLSFPYDFNQDGQMDLYVLNDLLEPNRLFINNSDHTFSEEAMNYGVDSSANDMGLAFGDYNNDGHFDMFITAIDQNFLFKNNGDNTFDDVAEDYEGLNNTLWSWGTRFADFDLDGDEDLFIGNGYYVVGGQPNFYYRNEYPANEFTDFTNQSGLLATTLSVDANEFDYDNDGDLDLIVTNSVGPVLFYENTTLSFDDEQPIKNWLKVELQGTVSNRNAIGTTVSLTTENINLKRYHTGIGFLSQSLKPLTFGLDDESLITTLNIKWPSGLIETYNNITPNNTVRVIEGQGLEVLDITPSQKTYGCTDPQSCSYNPEATVDDNSCVYLDAGMIAGNTNASVFSQQSYTYNQQNPEAVLNWEVIGGEIYSGQGTETIVVSWGLESSGTVTVIEANENCQSLPVLLNIDLSINDLPSHISIARLWNEVLLFAIRNDYARPTIHARNLFHCSAAMYDVWAQYNSVANNYLIGNNVHGFVSELEPFFSGEHINVSIPKAISYAMCRLLLHRFENSPGYDNIFEKINFVMDELEYDTTFTSLDYQTGDAAAFGNYVAEQYISYGLQDGAREQYNYDNAYYEPVNSALFLYADETSPLENPNHWQPLAFDIFIDQNGNIINDNVPDFLSPEWGNVNGFGLTDENKTTYTRDGNSYNVFYDPLDPPYISQSENNGINDLYKWGFSMVSVWQSHLDPDDNVMIDISPGAIGNMGVDTLPTSFDEYSGFYDYFNGGTTTNSGHPINPHTNQPYEQNIVKRGDYTRVLAEFWADGLDSETPPGHWFNILNYVNDHPLLTKQFQGEGPILEPLEWDVKSYFILGAGMHDAAISSWSIKGWYDYIRPISALRYMASVGQSSDSNLDNYHPNGIPLVPNYIENIEAGDPLAGINNENVGKIKLYTWRGHDYINNTATDVAGVGWIIAEDWFPYQRPTFVTPPFSGYVSGHSTFSRTAADILSLITGDEYFPGGIAEFTTKENDFLVFEKGPSQNLTLQWATYRDAADQTALSRIWGGIHPPFDDIPGRLNGEVIALETFNLATNYFQGTLNISEVEMELTYSSNPVQSFLKINATKIIDQFVVYNLLGNKVTNGSPKSLRFNIDMRDLKSGVYFIKLGFEHISKTIKIIKI